MWGQRDMSLPPPRWKWQCAWTASTDVEDQKGTRHDLEAGVFLRNLLMCTVHPYPNSKSMSPSVAALRVARAWRRARSQTGRRRAIWPGRAGTGLQRGQAYSDDRPTKSLVTSALPVGFPSPIQHSRRCKLNDYDGDDSDDGNDTYQHVYKIRKRCIRSCPHARVRASTNSAKPSATPIGEHHHPMATVHERSSTLRMRTIHVCHPQSSFPNQYASPLVISTAFHSTMQTPPPEPLRSP